MAHSAMIRAGVGLRATHALPPAIGTARLQSQLDGCSGTGEGAAPSEISYCGGSKRRVRGPTAGEHAKMIWLA